MNIPTEYYEDEFLEFEDKLRMTCSKKLSTMQPEKRSEYMLAKYNLSQIYRKKRCEGQVTVKTELVMKVFILISFFYV